MNNYNIYSHIYCGEKGIGKTTYVINKWANHILLNCENPLNKIKTTNVLEHALRLMYNKQYSDISEMIFSFSDTVSEGKVVIIDCVELINKEIFEIIINTLIPLKSSTIIFTFDMDSKELYQNEIFRLLIEWDLVPDKIQNNFQPDIKELKKFIKKEICEISCDMLSHLIKVSNFNFNNLKKLIWLVKNKQESFEKLSECVLTEYSYIMIEEIFSDIPQDLFEVLKKSSIIGEIFEKCILEAQSGFHIPGVKRYLEELETMNLFIHNYLSTDTYQFVSTQIYVGVLKCIDTKQKIEWERILIKYYMDRLKLSENNNELLKNLNRIKHLSISLNEQKTTYFANKRLLYCYSNMSDNSNALKILEELILYCKQNIRDSGLTHYLSLYKIRIQIKMGDFSDVLQSIYSIKSLFPNSLHLQYYRALSLYNNGDVDESYIHTQNLISRLEPTSVKATENQPIYSLTYSLMATLQNHFGIEDCGYKYYRLALNHALNKLQKKETYYTILKKCDMYYSYSFTKKMHLQSINFFIANNFLNEAAEVYLNLATEIMFNEVNSISESYNYFKKALKIFEYTPNWKLSYIKNNLAIFYIIDKGDFEKAVSLLEEALLVGMSAFTYFTIYLNLCICYLKLYGNLSFKFQSAYENFCKYNQLILSRKNATQYDNIYKQITDLIVMEHTGNLSQVINDSNKILSQEISSFFKPIIQDIIKRTKKVPDENFTYSDNAKLYTSLNEHKIFLAEFRFWE